jgi:hypothetical protein
MYRPRAEQREYSSLVSGQTGELIIGLEVARSGLLGKAFGSASVVVFVVWAVFARLDWVQRAEPDAAVALLLVLPGGLSFFVGRPEEHDLARRLLLGVRLMLILLSGLVYLVAGLLVLVPHDRHTSYPSWLACFLRGSASLASVVAGVMLAGLVLRSRRRSKGVPKMPMASAGTAGVLKNGEADGEDSTTPDPHP